MNLDLFSVPTQAFGWAGPWAMIATIVVYLIRIRPRMRELQASADGTLRKDMMAMIAMRDARIDNLEGQLRDERKNCDERIARLETIAFGPGSASTLRRAE